MLSTDQNPSCSSSKSSLLASDLVAPASGHELEGDHHQNPPIFSIRDYVLKSRSKDVRINWPFREQLLNFCLDNGITDLLPPLDPPSLVRSYCFQRDQLESKQAQNNIILSNGVSSDRSKHSPAEKRAISKVHSEQETGHDLSQRVSGEQSKNKCRLLGRLSSGIENITEEDQGLVSAAAVSDPMASKVCPVCKSFTSTSNTTLNAHIDQCLSMDLANAMKDIVAEFPNKSKVKPKKKRLMVDIYTTAPHSTLEDLDRRNGTNWVVSLATVAAASTDISMASKTMNLSPLDSQSNDVNAEPKRTKLVTEDIVRNDADSETNRMKLSHVDVLSDTNVGDIYIDSNGTKILILSKLDDSPPLSSRKKFKMRKHDQKEFKLIKSCSITKKKMLKQKPFMKENPHNRKLSFVSDFYSEIDKAAEGVHISEGEHMYEDHHDRGDSGSKRQKTGSQLLNANDQTKSSEPSTLGHWVCSKRSEISRKQSNKDMNQGSKKTIVNSRKLSSRHTHPDSIPLSIQQSCALSLPYLSEAVCSPKTKYPNVLSNTVRGMDAGRKTSLLSPDLNSKFTADDSLLDDPMARIRPSDTYHPPLKCRRLLTSKRSCFPRTCISLQGMNVASKKFKKRRLISRCSEGRRSYKYYSVNGGIDDSTVDFGPFSSRDNEASSIHDDQADSSENQEKGSLSNVTDAPDHDINLDPSIEVESISREETQMKVPDQLSISYEEAQCEDLVSNEVISQEFQREGDEAECQADRAVTLDDIQEKSSTNLVRVESSHDHHMIIDMDSSGSAFSTVSAIDLSSAASLDNNVKLPPPPAEPSCSCSESVARESQFSNHRKNTVSHLFIKPPAFSPFHQVCPSLESHNESVVTMDSSRISASTTPCSGSQSASNPILRLMGKDLVVSKEEFTHIPEEKFVSFAAPCNVGFISYHNPYGYQMQPMQMRSNMHNFPSPWTMNRMVAPQHHQPRPTFPSYQPNEVIVIDDDHHGLDPQPRTRFPTLLPAVQNQNLMAPRMFACFPSQNPYASRAFIPPTQRETSEGAFMFPSPSSLYFSPSLQ